MEGIVNVPTGYMAQAELAIMRSDLTMREDRLSQLREELPGLARTLEEARVLLVRARWEIDGAQEALELEGK